MRFIRYKRIVASVFVAYIVVLLSACQSNVKSDITTFRNDNVSFSTGTIFVTAQDPGVANSLEFTFYREKLEQRLKLMGYTPIGEGQGDEVDKQSAISPDYVAYLNYSVSRQESDSRRGRVYLEGY